METRERGEATRAANLLRGSLDPSDQTVRELTEEFNRRLHISDTRGYVEQRSSDTTEPEEEQPEAAISAGPPESTIWAGVDYFTHVCAICGSEHEISYAVLDEMVACPGPCRTKFCWECTRRAAGRMCTRCTEAVGPGISAVSYTHLTLPTKRIV